MTVGNQTNNNALQNLTETITLVNLTDNSKLEGLLPTTKLIELASTFATGQNNTITTDELKVAIVSFPWLQGYYSELFTGQKIIVNT